MGGGWSDKTKVILNSTQFKFKLKLKLELSLAIKERHTLWLFIIRLLNNHRFIEQHVSLVVVTASES